MTEDKLAFLRKSLEMEELVAEHRYLDLRDAVDEGSDLAVLEAARLYVAKRRGVEELKAKLDDYIVE